MTTDQEILTELAELRHGMNDLEARLDEHAATKSYRSTRGGTDYLLTVFSDGEVQLCVREPHSPSWGPAIKFEVVAG